MKKLRDLPELVSEGLPELVSELPSDFSIDPSTGILYHSNGSGKDIIGKVSIPENPHYSFLIYFRKFEIEKYEKYKEYGELLNNALAGKEIAGGSVLMLAPIPRS